MFPIIFFKLILFLFQLVNLNLSQFLVYYYFFFRSKTNLKTEKVCEGNLQNVYSFFLCIMLRHLNEMIVDFRIICDQ